MEKIKSGFFYIALILVANLSFMFGQTHRFIYELEFKQDSTSLVKQKELVVLDVSQEKVKFYDMVFLKTDSLRKRTQQDWKNYSRTNQTILRNRGSNVNFNYINVDGNYFRIKSIDDLKWQILMDTKSLGGMKLQKAECFFGGRKWIAWFNTEIPIYEGPYKFSGLPGLICELYDIKGNYHYTLQMNINLNNDFNTSEYLETYYGQRPLDITYLQYQIILRQKYDDPIKDLRYSIQNQGQAIIDDKIIKNLEELNLVKINKQKSIKTNNNPIEIDKAVKYTQ